MQTTTGIWLPALEWVSPAAGLPSTPRATALGDTLDALAAAALATIRRFTPEQPVRPWPVINVLTRGRLLAPAFSP